MRPRQLILPIFISILLQIPIGAQSRSVNECWVVNQDGKLDSFSMRDQPELEVARIDTMADIDPDIAARILYRIGKHVGDDAERKIRFSGGYSFKGAVDRTIYYRLRFTFSDKPNGLVGFGFEVLAGDFGESVKLFDVPSLSIKPEKGQIIPCSTVVKMAEQRGISRSKRSITFGYDQISDSFVWLLFDNRMEPDNDEWSDGRPTVKVIAIQAHTGNILRVYEGYP